MADPSSQAALAALGTTPVQDESGTAVATANPNFLLNNVPLTGYTGTNFPTDAKTSNFMVINSIAIDKQTEFLTYTATSSNPNLVTASTNDEWLTLNYVPEQTGTATITVTATDLYGFTASQSFTVTVNPAPPVVTGVTVAPNNITNTTTLTAKPSATDPEGKPVTYTYQWLKNNTIISGATSATLTLSSANLSANNQLTVQVTPNDGVLSGAAFTSNTITIATVSPTTLQPPKVLDVVIAPNSATAATTLTAEPSLSQDPLGEPLLGSIQWLKNGVAIAGATSSTLTLSTVSFKANDQFSVRIIIGDGTLTAPAYTSSAVTVATVSPHVTLNPPVIQTVSIAPDNANNATELIATLNSTSPTNFDLQWYQDGFPISGVNSLSLSLTSGSFTVSAGDVFTLEATPVEGPLDGATVTSNNITIDSLSPIKTS